MVYDKDITIIGKALLHNTLSISLIFYYFLDVFFIVRRPQHVLYDGRHTMCTMTVAPFV